jgi:hypothetical protein
MENINIKQENIKNSTFKQTMAGKQLKIQKQAQNNQ